MADQLIIYTFDFGSNANYYARLKDRSVKATRNADHRGGTFQCTLTGTIAQLGAALDPNVIPESVVLFDLPSLSFGDYVFYGPIRRVTGREIGNGGSVELLIEAQDWSSAAADTICDPNQADPRRFHFRVGTTNLTESDAQRIDWLLSAFAIGGFGASIVGTAGGFVDTILSPISDQDFTGMTLAEAFDDICRLSGATWYIDDGLNLHYRLPETGVATAPFSLSNDLGAIDNVTVFGYRNLQASQETTDIRNRVVVIGGNGLHDTYAEAPSVALYGAKTGVIQDAGLLDVTALANAGAAYLLANAYPNNGGSVECFQPGLEPGQIIGIDDVFSGQSFNRRIASITTTFPVADGPVFQLTFGDAPPNRLPEVLRKLAANEASRAVGDVFAGSATFGHHYTVQEVAVAPTGAPITGQVYAIDNGAGKTKLMVKFETGAAQQIAIEP